MEVWNQYNQWTFFQGEGFHTSYKELLAGNEACLWYRTATVDYHTNANANANAN